MIIAGIDPGLASVGLALVDVGDRFPSILSADTVHTSPTEGLELRWRRVWDALGNLLDDAQALGIEEQHDVIAGMIRQRATNANALRSLECVGLVRAWALSRKLPVTMVTPKEAKIAVLGSKSSRASKEQVEHAVRAICRGKFAVGEHAADAVAIAIAAGKRFHWESVTRASPTDPEVLDSVP